MNDSIGGMNQAGPANLAQLQLQNLRYNLPEGSEADQLRQVAQDFEAIFMKQMLDSMRGTLNSENRLVDTGMAGEFYEDMLYDEYAQIMAKTGGIGLADMIVKQHTP
ncbi:flagellar protein FlgJ [Alkalispirochaeta americana]|uniref:Flagellar protein FlgJ n=1 Tax=Alkalispirochaeta americana TaxID=159291 RepID=A0A1N6PX32_9SPIO|nr:rod-binding protein [Alkalispirochaeta americana]SIQ08890.1 flagellar protein FlgJ [Alkalispirochaeta americana]